MKPDWRDPNMWVLVPALMGRRKVLVSVPPERVQKIAQQNMKAGCNRCPGWKKDPTYWRVRYVPDRQREDKKGLDSNQ